MTPLIAEFAGYVPAQAVDFRWFEMAPWEGESEVDTTIFSHHLPFDRTAVVCSLNRAEAKVLMLLKQHGEMVGCTPLMLVRGVWQRHKQFGYVFEDGKVRVWHRDGSNGYDPKPSAATSFLVLIGEFLRSLDAGPVTAYQPAKRPSHAKRMHQGKKPTYDWTTIVIEPPKPKAAPAGGTHASPRWHERRGHWRNTRSGKRVWVRHCEVGDKAKGAVFHDYKITH